MALLRRCERKDPVWAALGLGTPRSRERWRRVGAKRSASARRTLKKGRARRNRLAKPRGRQKLRDHNQLRRSPGRIWSARRT
jgi:hypothetical protein